MAELDEAAAEVVGALEAAGAACLLLKGPAIAQMLYRDGEHRGYSDIDLLVTESELDRAREALSGLGFQLSAELIAPGIVAADPHAETWSRRARATKGGPVVVDLHWRLDGCEATWDATWTALWSRSAEILVSGRPVRVLNVPGLAFHVALHAAQHGPGDLKAIADLHRALERWARDVWGEAAELARAVQGTPSFAAGLRLTPGGVLLADELRLPETDELTRALLRREGRPPGAFHLGALSEARGFGEHVALLRSALLPSRHWIARRYPWAASSSRRMAAARAAHLVRAPSWAARAWWYRRRQRKAGPGTL